MSYNVLSLHGLIAWLEKFPSATSYCYGNERDCLAARYLRAHGLSYGLSEGYPIPRIFDTGFRAQLEDIAQQSHPYTYGSALRIARALAHAERQAHG